MLFARKLVILCCCVILTQGNSTNHDKSDFCERDEVTGACKSPSSVDTEDEEPCWEGESTGNKEQEYGKLVRLEGVKVGHEQFVEIDGKSYKLITKALRPLLFEIPDFLTEDETATLEEEGILTGMFSSKAKGGLTAKDVYKPIAAPGQSVGISGKFEFWDFNSDGKIEMSDILDWTKYYSFLSWNESDVKEMFKAIGDKSLDDGVITREEFPYLNTQGVDDYLNILVREHPRFRQRFSEQTFMAMSKMYSHTAHDIRERVVKLTKLPRRLVYEGEHLQIVKYGVNGHYHTHQDSETHTRTDKPCCHHTDSETVKQYGTCRLCRFITIIFYLNDVEEGGETAFPVADNATFSVEALRRRGEELKDVKDLYNLSHYCKDANLVISPRRGQAVMWYNHLIDPKTGWLGEMEDRALHGGCDVTKGEKWIANMWLTAPYADSVGKPSMYFDEEDFQIEEGKNS